VYFSPILVVVVLAFIAASMTVLVLNKLKLSRHVYAHSYIFVGIMVLYMVLIDAFLIKF